MLKSNGPRKSAAGAAAAAAFFLLLCRPAGAADENARRDANNVPSLIGVSSSTGETRRIKASNDGFLLIQSTGTPAASTVNQGSSGSQEWRVRAGSDTSSIQASQLGSWTATANQGTAGSAEWKVRTGSDTSSVQSSQLGSWAVGLNAGANSVGTVAISSSNAAINAHQAGAWTVTANAGSGTFDTSGSTVQVRNASGESLAVADGGGSLTVDAVDLDVRDLSAGQDSVRALQEGSYTVTPGTGTFLVGDGAGPLTVDGTVSANLNAGANSIGAVAISSANAALNAFQAGAWTVTANAGSGSFNVTGSTVTVGDGAGPLTIDGTVNVGNAGGGSAVNVQDGGNSLTVDGVDFDVRDLTPAQDGVRALQEGSYTVTPGTGTFTVGATDLDIRDLSAAQDSVRAKQEGSYTVTAGTGTFLVGDGSGPLTVDGTVSLGAGASQIGTVSGSTVAVHNAGGTSLAVNDNGGSITVDGTVTVGNGAGGSAVNIQDGGNSITIDGSVTSEGAAIGTLVASTGTCATGSATLAIAANSEHKDAEFCNEGTSPVRIGPAGITSAIGRKVLPDTCVSPGGPTHPFRADLYCTSTVGSTVDFSTLRGQ